MTFDFIVTNMPKRTKRSLSAKKREYNAKRLKTPQEECDSAAIKKEVERSNDVEPKVTLANISRMN